MQTIPRPVAQLYPQKIPVYLVMTAQGPRLLPESIFVEPIDRPEFLAIAFKGNYIPNSLKRF